MTASYGDPAVRRVCGTDRPVTVGTRSGFTLIELLVSVVLGALILGSIYQVLVTNQRISSLQRERVLGQQTVRAGLDVLAQELRETSAVGGDLLTMSPGEIRFRALRNFGIACQVVNSVPPVLTVAYEGNPFAAGDGVYVFADGEGNTSNDDQWFTATANTVVNGLTCGADNLPAQGIGLSAPNNQPDVDLIRQGAILRGWEAITYRLGVVDGEVYLVRTVGLETARLVGPLPENGLTFEYLDVNGNAVAVATSVARVKITLRVTSDARDQQGELLTDSLSTSVFLRN